MKESDRGTADDQSDRDQTDRKILSIPAPVGQLLCEWESFGWRKRQVKREGKRQEAYCEREKPAQASHRPTDVILMDNLIWAPDRQLCTHFLFLHLTFLFVPKEKRLLQAPPKGLLGCDPEWHKTQARFVYRGSNYFYPVCGGFSIGLHLLILALISVASLNLVFCSLLLSIAHVPKTTDCTGWYSQVAVRRINSSSSERHFGLIGLQKRPYCVFVNL